MNPSPAVIFPAQYVRLYCPRGGHCWCFATQVDNAYLGGAIYNEGKITMHSSAGFHYSGGQVSVHVVRMYVML